LLDRLQIPDPWRADVDVSLELIDDLELQIARLTVALRRMGADHRYLSLLVTAPGSYNCSAVWLGRDPPLSRLGSRTRGAHAS
jgi:hypothetical protein